MKKTTKTKTEAQLAAERAAEAVFTASGIDGVVEAAWDALEAGDRTRLRALEKVAHREPALARTFRVFDWAKKAGFERDGLRLEHELHVAALGLATRGDPRILPFVFALVAKRWIGEALLAAFLDSDAVPRERALGRARAWIPASRSLDEIELAGRILARFGEARDAEALATSFDGVLAGMQTQVQGFGSVVARCEARVTVGVLARALVTCGVPTSLVPALHHLLTADSYWLEEVRGHVALLLAAHALHAPHGSRIELAAKLRAAGPFKHVLAEAGRLAALRDLGDDVALEPALEKVLADANDKYEHRVAALDLVATRKDVGPALAVRFVGSNDARVHRAAVRALRMRKQPVPEVHVYDPLTVLELQSRGPDALAAALTDPRGVYREHVVLALGDTPDARFAEPLETFARELAASPLEDDLAYALRWTLRALARIGVGAPLMDELLRSDNEKVAEAVVRNGELVARGIERGMTHVALSRDDWARRAALEWLRKHPSPETTSALAERGLMPEDLKLLLAR